MKPICGRPTEICITCHHHRKCHKAGTCATTGPRASCKVGKYAKHIVGEPCHTFTARPCEQTHLMPNGCCHAHGGAMPNGPAHWSYQGKGYSTALPKRMQQDYLDARADPERLSLEHEIGELRALKADIWKSLTGDMALAVNAVHVAATDIKKHFQLAALALKNGNTDKFNECWVGMTNGLTALEDALSPIAAFEHARAVAVDLTVKTDRLVRTENTVKIAERGMVSLEAALADRHTLIIAVLGAVDKHVRDTEVQATIRRSVGAEYARLTGRRDAKAVDAGSGPPIVDAEYSSTTD